jgi:hypothetical protein
MGWIFLMYTLYNLHKHGISSIDLHELNYILFHHLWKTKHLALFESLEEVKCYIKEILEKRFECVKMDEKKVEIKESISELGRPIEYDPLRDRVALYDEIMKRIEKGIESYIRNRKQ